MASSAPASAQPRWTARPGSAGTGRRRMRRTAAREPQHAAAARIAAQPRGSQPARTVHNPRGTAPRDCCAASWTDMHASNRSTRRSRADRSVAARTAAQPRGSQPARTVHNPRGTARRAGSAASWTATHASNRSTRTAARASRAHCSAAARIATRAPYTTRAGPPGGLVRRGPPGVQSEALGRSVRGTIG